MATTPLRNALGVAFEHGAALRTAVETLAKTVVETPIELLDDAYDIGTLLDTWSRRTPLNVTSGERMMMHDIFRDAEEELAEIDHDPALDRMLADAEHCFNAALAGQNVLHPQMAVAL